MNVIQNNRVLKYRQLGQNMVKGLVSLNSE